MGNMCKGCEYYAPSLGCCDYAEMTGKLRTVKDGKIRTDLKKNQCDVYRKSEKKEDVNRAVEKRINWCKVKYFD